MTEPSKTVDGDRHPHILQADKVRRGYPPLPGWDGRYSFFYDETNNAGHVVLNEDGLPAEADKTFVLGGVVLKPGQQIESIDELRRSIKLQSNAGELKFRHVAHGNYEDVLSSRKLASFLAWLTETGACVHYSVVNILYWSLIDIIESLMGDDPVVMMMHMHLKSELFKVVVRSQAEFMMMLHSFDYPNLAPARVTEFMDEISAFLGRHAVNDRGETADLLRRTISDARHRDSLVFLHSNEPYEVVDNFGLQFAHRVILFKNASHTFDRETSIEKFFKRHELRDGARRLDYKFVDSRDSVSIQVADVVAGLFGKHFDFAHRQSMATVRARKSRLTEIQLSNLAAMRALVDRSDEVSPAFLHSITTVDAHAKSNFLMFDVEPGREVM